MSLPFQKLEEEDGPEENLSLPYQVRRERAETQSYDETGLTENDRPVEIEQFDCVAPDTNDSAKEFFQCFCVLFYSSTSIAITLYNKWLLSEYNFKFPIAMIFYQFLWITGGSWIFIFLFFRKKYSEHDDWITKMTLAKFCRTILPLSCFLCFDIVCTQLGLMLSSVTLAEIIKSLIPVFVFISSILFGFEIFTAQKFTVILAITIGIGLTSKGEKDLKLIGLVFFSAASLCATLKLLFIERIVGDKRLGMPALLTLAYISTTSLPILLIGFLSIEFTRLRDSPFATDPSMFWGCIGFLTIGAALAFLLNISEIMLVGTTSAISTCVVGIAKVVVLMLISQLIFKPDLNQTKVSGVIVTLVAVLGYNLIKFQERSARKKLQKYQIMDIPGDKSYEPQDKVSRNENEMVSLEEYDEGIRGPAINTLQRVQFNFGDQLNSIETIEAEVQYFEDKLKETEREDDSDFEVVETIQVEELDETGI